MEGKVELTEKEFVNTLRHDTYPAIDPTQWVERGDFAGRVVLITGASRGIGRAIALAFARAGVSGLIIAARNINTLDSVEKESQNVHSGGELEVLKLAVDVSLEHSVADAARVVKAKFGRLDVLVNNAGILEPFSLIIDSSPSVWWSTWEVNVKGTYLVTRAFLGLLLENGISEVKRLEGRKIIVNVSSKGATQVEPGLSAYDTGKLAILRFTEFLASEYGARGLLAFSLHPGGVLTDMASVVAEQFRDILIDSPELVADTLVWLVRERREWLNGRFLVVNWDVNELEAKKEEVVKGDKLKVRLVV